MADHELPLHPNLQPPHGWPAFDERSVPGVLERSWRAFPDKVALLDSTRALTYAELWSSVMRRASGLRELGIGPGDRVLLMLDNHVDYVLSWFAITMLGAVQVPINTAYRGPLLHSLVARAGASVAIVEAGYVERLALAPTRQGRVANVVARGDTQIMPARMRARVKRLEGLDLRSELAARPHVGPWHLHSLMLTSGTTGPSRLVSVPHGLTYSDSDPEWFPGAASDDTVFVSLPLFHVSGQGAVYNGIVVGATVAIGDRFHSSSFWAEATRYRATFAPILGVMPNFLMNRPPSPVDRAHTLRRIRMAPVIANLDEFTERFGVEVGSAYGMTEVSNPICAPFGWARPGSCGWLRDDFEVRIVDGNDQIVSTGSVGELIVRPRVPWTVSTGYFGDSAATTQGWRNLWLHTGDVFRAGTNGEYYFLDRLKDAIRRRGENISSFEVEQIVNSHPEVEESAVVGLCDHDGDEEVHAILVLRPGGELAPADLAAYLSERLPAFMVPKFITVVDELPKTPSGKVRKHSLREAGLDDGTWCNSGA